MLLFFFKIFFSPSFSPRFHMYSIPPATMCIQRYAFVQSPFHSPFISSPPPLSPPPLFPAVLLNSCVPLRQNTDISGAAWKESRPVYIGRTVPSLSPVTYAHEAKIEQKSNVDVVIKDLRTWGFCRKEVWGGQAVLWIQICGIRMLLGLPDPDPSLFCTDPDPFINIQKSKFFVTSYCWILM